MELIETQKQIKEWYKAAPITDFNEDAGTAVLYGEKQIAVYYFADEDKWYASQNACPHRLEMALSRGLLGTDGDEPKVACPFHKKTFSLKTGKCLSGDDLFIETYPVKIKDGFVFIGIPECD